MGCRSRSSRRVFASFAGTASEARSWAAFERCLEQPSSLTRPMQRAEKGVVWSGGDGDVTD